MEASHALENKYVFKWDLKMSVVWDDFINNGQMFHNLGATTEKPVTFELPL